MDRKLLFCHAAARLLVAFFVLASAGGCSLFGTSGNSQVTKCQQEKEQLLGSLRVQRDQLASLRTQNEKLASRLDEAEKELARGPATRRFAGWDSSRNFELAKGPAPSTKSSADGNPAPPETTATAPPTSVVESSKLPWKPYRPGVEDKNDWKLLTQQHRWLKYDEAAGGLIVDAPVEFESDGVTLTRASKETLDELSRLLKEGAGKELRIVVASQAPGNATNPRQTAAQRAGNVADYLDRHGIASDRLAVAAAAPARGEETARALTIHLLDRDAPLVGLAPKSETQRR